MTSIDAARSGLATRKEAEYWNDHQHRGPTNIQRGFLDTGMIPNWHRYETVQHVAQTMWLLKRKLEVTPSGLVVRKASVRVYRDMKSLVDQASINLDWAMKQLEQQRRNRRGDQPQS